MASSRNLYYTIVAACCSLYLPGCAVGPDFEQPLAPLTDSFTESVIPDKTVETQGAGGAAQHFVKGGDIPACWWKLYHSKHINDLIEKGMKNNNTLEAARAALRAAEAQYNAVAGQLFPAVTYGFSAQREKLGGAAINGSAGSSRIFNVFTQGFNLSYTLDVFGGIRRQIEAAGAQVDFQDFEEKATYLTLTANIVKTSVVEASLRAQIEATEKLVALLEKNLVISKESYRLGAKSKIDTLAQETQLYQTKALITPLKNDLAQTRTALSVLIGELPSESKLPVMNLTELTLPTEVPLSIPSCLVHQRPDIKAAEALLHAASAQIGVATANLLPQFTILGNYGGSSNFIEDLFKKSANVWSISGNVLQPIFDGGILFSQREAAIATFEQAYAQYRQVVLEAYKNVADILYALELDAQQLQIETEAERAAAETLRLTQIQYNLGAVSYLNLIIAQRQYLVTSIGRIQALASRYTNTAALFHALGGGWWNSKCLCRSPSNEEKGLESVS